MNGVVSMATGRYNVFVQPLVDAVANTDFCDRMFVLTDDGALLSRATVKPSRGLTVEYLPWGSMPWPFPTLWRYHAMASYEDRLSEVEHLLYLDIDMRPNSSCPELFGPDLLAVTHPGYWDKSLAEATFCRDRRSVAHHEPREGDVYVAGGVQGGRSEAYLAACRSLAAGIELDHRKGVTAVWHDESHWNRYVNTHIGVNVLGPEFCWPEHWTENPPSGVARIEALFKDHDEFRDPIRHTWSQRMRHRVGQVIGR